ncbi:unnamed protein product [Rotaria sp. Silwood1]|nr:unnamed protein product [Rotaria sp. Silwood1]CAF1499508.1 unnamed protein product [Rotaria sp. Silwood1]CAF3623539.1 unnamed protein product [Rotaria sp. Silwood1]CAF4672889.1 unnamed protein product [Rotaria sp. Silwood1]CAF4677260.1 unnamed protein product [Rotaria sp. Silwood1]
MILHHGSSKTMSNGLALPDLSLRRTSSRSTTAKALNTIKSIDTQREKLLKQFGSSGLVVLDLVKYVPVGSAIFIDNYFASTKLIKTLTELVGWKDSKRVLLGSNHIGVEPITTLKRWDKEKQCRVDVTASQIINNYNKFMGGVDNVMVINSWIIMNSRLCGDDSYNSTSHGKFRLFHFKSEIAKFLLTKTNIQIFPTAAISSSVNVYQNDEENEPPTKKLREARSSVTDVVRYDSSDHWPLFVSGLNNTRFIEHITFY